MNEWGPEIAIGAVAAIAATLAIAALAWAWNTTVRVIRAIVQWVMELVHTTLRKGKEVAERCKAAKKAFIRKPEQYPRPDTFVGRPHVNEKWEYTQLDKRDAPQWRKDREFHCLPNDLAYLCWDLAITSGLSLMAQNCFRLAALRRSPPWSTDMIFAPEHEEDRIMEHAEIESRSDIPISAITKLGKWMGKETTNRDHVRELCKQVWLNLWMDHERKLGMRDKAIVGEWNNDPEKRSLLVKIRGYRDTVWYIAVYNNTEVAGCWRGTVDTVPDSAVDYLFNAVSRFLPTVDPSKLRQRNMNATE